jgi:GNAT superfamily N-acetyltransferase
MENAPIEIVTLSPNEWQAYRQLRLEALQDSPQAFGTSYQEQLARPDSYWQTRLADAALGEKSWLRFARSGGQLVGMMGAFCGRSDDQTVRDEATIIAVYVSPAWRGRGISTLLMQAILDVLKENGIRRAHLGVNGQQAAAVNLYLRFGFVSTSNVTNKMADGLVHAEYLMEKAL